LKAFTLVALNTGMRRNEILALTHQMIDRANRLVRLTTTKNHEARAVHLNDTAFAAIESLPRRLDGKLWPWTPNQASMAFQRAVRRAGIPDFRLHDLRHTFASYQAMAGTTGKALQELVGHKDGRMTARYTHLSADFLRAAINAVQLGGTPANSGAQGRRQGVTQTVTVVTKPL
ncbi:MAG TPA: site-specific integrase, partial [Candidatus Binataceae bacterium]|nr:site-specific integrase [Candidatus Binataceae bacterium]